MKKRLFGPTARQVPVLGQGTWNMEHDDRTRALEALRRGLDLGMVHVDTAEMYGRGEVEDLVGEAIAGRRDEVFLATKVLPEHASYEGTLRACEHSLGRLGTDRLDLYLLHWRGQHPLEETFRAFEKLEADGKILAWGVSNFDVDDLDEALAIVGEGKIACNQVLYHLGERTIEHGVLPWCEAHRVAVVAYSPFGSAGHFPHAGSSGGRVLEQVGRAHGKTPREVALAFLTRRASVFAIPKSSLRHHVEENAFAAAIELSPKELERIDAAFPRGPEGALPML